MKLLISNSAARSKYEVDARVAARFANNEWYLGTISRMRGTGIVIMFDDGERHVFDSPTASTVKVVPAKTRKRKSALTNAEVKELVTPTSKVTEAEPQQPVIKEQKSVVKQAAATNPVVEPVSSKPDGYRYLVKQSGRSLPFNSFDDAFNYALDNGLDPEKVVFSRKQKQVPAAQQKPDEEIDSSAKTNSYLNILASLPQAQSKLVDKWVAQEKKKSGSSSYWTEEKSKVAGSAMSNLVKLLSNSEAFKKSLKKLGRNGEVPTTTEIYKAALATLVDLSS